MKPREILVQDFARLSRPLSEIRKELSEYDWDCENELYEMTSQDVIGILKIYLSDKINETELASWAFAVEDRDDLGFEEKNYKKTWEVVFCLASPEINFPITKDLVLSFIRNLNDEAYQGTSDNADNLRV